MLDGFVLWGARVVVLPPGREQVIEELCKIHVHPGNGTMKRLARSHVWWASLNGDLEAKVQTCIFQVSVKSTPGINLVLRPSCTCEKVCLVFFLSHGVG